MTAGLIFALGCAVLAILYGVWQSTRILRLPAGSERMREISAAVREGAVAYLRRQCTTIAIVGVVLFLVIGFVPQLGWSTAFGFLVGALLSGACGVIGMNISVRAASAVRTLARTEMFMPMMPQAPERSAPIRKPKAVGQPSCGTRPMMMKSTAPTIAIVVYWRRR